MQFSVAPMMEYTDVHMRYLFRLLSRRATLYTEMVPCPMIVHASQWERALEFNEDMEHPVVLQVGGSDVDVVRTALEKVKR